MSIGRPDAPNVIVEYASMTCPHCAQFDKDVFPELKTKYIDTGESTPHLPRVPARRSRRARLHARPLRRVRPLLRHDRRHVPDPADLGGRGARGARPPAPARAPEPASPRRSSTPVLPTRTCSRRSSTSASGRTTSSRSNSTPTFFVNGKRIIGEHELEGFRGDAKRGGDACS